MNWNGSANGRYCQDEASYSSQEDPRMRRKRSSERESSQNLYGNGGGHYHRLPQMGYEISAESLLQQYSQMNQADQIEAA